LWYNGIAKSHDTQAKGAARMTNYSTLGHNLKRGIFKFSKNISDGLYRPAQKFVADMTYGLLSAQSCYLTEIARKLKENIALDKTVERLSRNLMNFDDADTLHEQYFKEIEPHFDESTILIIDDSDVAKPCSSKLEGLCKVRDGSTGEITDGYWYAGVSALAAKRKQPIPVYSRVYSSAEEGYVSNNAETLKSFAFLSSHFPKTTIRALDRGYDGGYVFDYFIPREEAFIVRMKGRNLLHKGETILLSQLAKRYKGKYALKFEAKNGKKADCKISIVPVSLPAYPNVSLNLVICNGLGKEPLLLLTNLKNDDKRLPVTITKVYLMRWRIEEYYKFKKHGFGFEKFLVRSLKSIRNLDLLLSISIGYIGILSEKIDESIEVLEIIEASKRLYGLSKFTFYAIADGLAEIFSKLYTGIFSFFRRLPTSDQLCFGGWE
jgi:hypothetical protein